MLTSCHCRTTFRTYLLITGLTDHVRGLRSTARANATSARPCGKGASHSASTLPLSSTHTPTCAATLPHWPCSVSSGHNLSFLQFKIYFTAGTCRLCHGPGLGRILGQNLNLNQSLCEATDCAGRHKGLCRERRNHTHLHRRPRMPVRRRHRNRLYLQQGSYTPALDTLHRNQRLFLSSDPYRLDLFHLQMAYQSPPFQYLQNP